MCVCVCVLDTLYMTLISGAEARQTINGINDITAINTGLKVRPFNANRYMYIVSFITVCVFNVKHDEAWVQYIMNIIKTHTYTGCLGNLFPKKTLTSRGKSFFQFKTL